jgi:hypothetical protein
MRLFRVRTFFFKLSPRAEKLHAVALITGPLERARRETRVVVASMVNLWCVVYYNEITIGKARAVSKTGKKRVKVETIMLASRVVAIPVDNEARSFVDIPFYFLSF